MTDVRMPPKPWIVECVAIVQERLGEEFSFTVTWGRDGEAELHISERRYRDPFVRLIWCDGDDGTVESRRAFSAVSVQGIGSFGQQWFAADEYGAAWISNEGLTWFKMARHIRTHFAPVEKTEKAAP